MNKIKVKEGQIWVNADRLSLLVTRIINKELVRTLVLAPKYFGSSSDPLVLLTNCELVTTPPPDGPWRALCITDGPILVDDLHQCIGVVHPETLQVVMRAIKNPCSRVISKEQWEINALYLDMLAEKRKRVLAKISE